MNIQSFKFNNFTYFKQTPLKTTPVSFKGAFKNERTLKDLDPRDFEYWQAFYRILEPKTYENASTKKHDNKIKEYEEELSKRNINLELAYGIAYSSIDKKTGKISPIAKYVVDCFIPPKQKPLQYSLQEEISNYKRTYFYTDYLYKQIPMILESLKDKDGHFSNENLKIFEEITKKQLKDHYTNLQDSANLINYSKNDAGIVDEDLFSYATIAYKQGEGTLKENIDTLKPFSKEKRKEIYNFCDSLYNGDNNYKVFNLPYITLFCFDKDGNKIEDKAKLVESIIKDKPYALYDDASIFELCYNSQDFSDIYSKIKRGGLQEIVKNSITEFLDEDGNLPTQVKTKMEDFLMITEDLSSFSEIYNTCNNTKNGIFDENLFEETILLIALSNFYKLDMLNSVCFKITSGNFDTDKMMLSVKIKNFEKLEKIISYLAKDCPEKSFANVHKIYNKLKDELSPKNVFNPISKENKNNAIQNIFHVNGRKSALTEFETTIKESIPLLESHYRGLPLKYSRKSFLQDLEELCKKNPNAKEIIKTKTKIDLIADNNNHFVGYNNMISLKDLNKEDELEKEIFDYCHKFLYENEIETEDKNLNQYLNYIIKAFPEFINVIGKKQHSTHDFTVDIHSLLVMAHSIENPIYKNNLDKEDKITLILTTLLHDISKQENTIDKSHPEVSAKTTREIVRKVFPNTNFSERIYDFINNHHFLETLSKTDDKRKTCHKLAFAFRRPHDLYIAKIIAEADLKSVNDYFFDTYKDCLSADNFLGINHDIFLLNANGNAIYTTPIIYPKKAEKMCKKTINGKEYTIINLHKIRENENMGKYGFANGLKKKDLRFLVHMTNDLETLSIVSNSNAQNLLSETLISPSQNGTYYFRDYGVFLSQPNTNTINMTKENQASGNEKDLNTCLSLIFDDKERENFKWELLKQLNIKDDEVKNKDFAAFYMDVLAKKNSFSQINPKEKFSIGKHEFTGKELISAIKLVQNTFLNSTEHNEIVGYKPEIKGVIAKVTSEEDIHKIVLDFAYKNNYPIVLI